MRMGSDIESGCVLRTCRLFGHCPDGVRDPRTSLRQLITIILISGIMQRPLRSSDNRRLLPGKVWPSFRHGLGGFFLRTDLVTFFAAGGSVDHFILLPQQGLGDPGIMNHSVVCFGDLASATLGNGATFLREGSPFLESYSHTVHPETNTPDYGNHLAQRWSAGDPPARAFARSFQHDLSTCGCGITHHTVNIIPALPPSSNRMLCVRILWSCPIQ